MLAPARAKLIGGRAMHSAFPPQDSWIPILSGDDRLASLRVCEDIADALTISPSAQVDVVGGGGLAGGNAGLALFWYYYAMSRPDQADHAFRESERQLDVALQAVAKTYQPATLFSGFVGVAWTVAHLQRVGCPWALQVDLAEVDAAVGQYLASDRLTRVYDVISGIVGLGVYALERAAVGERPDWLDDVVAVLVARSVPEGPGVTWLAPPESLGLVSRARFPTGCYNFGLAHGVPGVIAFLGMLAIHDAIQQTATDLLKAAVRWLQANQLSGDGRSQYSTMCTPHHPPSQPSRDAWCYGDPGIATALYIAGIATKDRDLTDSAVELLRDVAHRDDDGAGVHDAPICHGAAGLTLIFSRMYNATGDPVFRDAATRWARQVLDMQSPGTGLGGYQFRGYENGTYVWQDRAGLLEGSAGIGLVLLAAATPQQPQWDRFLLTDLSVSSASDMPLHYAHPLPH